VDLCAILVAAGRGARIGGPRPKAFLPLAGKPLFFYALRTLCTLSSVRSIILVVAPDWRQAAQFMVAEEKGLDVPILIAAGGEQRQDSVAAGLACVDDADLVIVHDAARPFASKDLFAAVVEAAAEFGAAIAALPAQDTVKLAAPGELVQGTIDRSQVWLAQTPQVFRVDLLRQAYEKAAGEGFIATDDAGLIERLGDPVRLVRGEPDNRKVTTREDLIWAEWYAGRGLG
jgi:2-C-methyl-D-erythritol 4-phosphate cytidylyltransferase